MLDGEAHTPTVVHAHYWVLRKAVALSEASPAEAVVHAESGLGRDLALLEPLGDEAVACMDVNRLEESAVEHLELVWNEPRHDEHVATGHHELLITGDEKCLPASDDEGFAVRMSMQPRARARLDGVLLDDRDLGPRDIALEIPVERKLDSLNPHLRRVLLRTGAVEKDQRDVNR